MSNDQPKRVRHQSDDPTLAEFLLARIAEDEVVAHDVAPGPWLIDGPPRDSRVYSTPTGVSVAAGWQRDLAHIARWDPTRVLRECEAKRRIVEQISNLRWVGSYLAQPYADHPDYRDEWCP